MPAIETEIFFKSLDTKGFAPGEAEALRSKIENSPSLAAHEKVGVFKIEGRICVIAVHSTALGPAAGGIRMHTYLPESAIKNVDTWQAGIDDVLRLSHTMSRKNALADLPFGGGKAVLIGDPETNKSPELFRKLGEAIASFNGDYYGAEDSGVNEGDLEYVREKTAYVAGLRKLSGNPSPTTAKGVFQCLQISALERLGRELSDNVTVAVMGLGNVGARLADMLYASGANLIVADEKDKVAVVVAARTGAKKVSPDQLLHEKFHIYSPNALSDAIAEGVPELLSEAGACAVVGGANNQLKTPDMGQKLFDRGILYAPEYAINGGGIIRVASEILAVRAGKGIIDESWVDSKVTAMVANYKKILQVAAQRKEPPFVVADEMADGIIAAAAGAKLARTATMGRRGSVPQMQPPPPGER